MVKTLILMRHAQASDERGISDFERSLTPSGVRDARHMSRWIKKELGDPELILSSDAIRAAMTAEIVSEELGLTHLLHFEHDLYEASIRTLLSVVNQVDDTCKKLLVIAHNPSLSYLSDYLSDKAFPGLQPASLVVIQFENVPWTNLAQQSGKFILYRSPSEVE